MMMIDTILSVKQMGALRHVFSCFFIIHCSVMFNISDLKMENCIFCFVKHR